MRFAAVFIPFALSACSTLEVRRTAVAAEAGVAFDASGERGHFAQGEADRLTGRKVTIDDPVRVASVSKLVTAIRVMQLVDEGKVDVTGDVSKWLGWRLRNPAFPDRPMTLTMLL